MIFRTNASHVNVVFFVCFSIIGYSRGKDKKGPNIAVQWILPVSPLSLLQLHPASQSPQYSSLSFLTPSPPIFLQAMPPSPSEPRGGGKWRKRAIKPTNPRRNRLQDDEDDDDDNDDDHNNNNNDDIIEADEDEDLHPNPNSHQHHHHHQQQQVPLRNQHRASASAAASVARESEVLADAGVRISDFPAVVKRTLTRYHSSVMGIVAMERAGASGDRDRQLQLQQQSSGGGGGIGGVILENVSYGQLQALSAVPADTAVLLGLGDQENTASSYVVTPPAIMEGKGVKKKFWNGRVHVVPMHADWFSVTTVHRLERQVVPHFFSGKSTEYTPERYLDCRNLIVAKYMENPEKSLSISECQGLGVAVGNEDLGRIFRFLDHWGLINSGAAKPNQESWNVDSYLREDPSGEVHVPSASLKSIDSLIKFDKPTFRINPGDIYSSLSSNVDDLSDLDCRIRERLSENCCSYCSRPLLILYYQSVKEPDTLLCANCYHEGRFIIGHSSINFTRVESTKDFGDPDGENWTDEETLLLLEALELYTDNWNEIADHVGTRSKAQCILHFLRLPMEDGLLENVHVPGSAMTSKLLNEANHERSFVNSNGETAGHPTHNSLSECRLPFEDSGNPVMSLVSFLASAVGPRVAAACAHACLAELSEDDGGPASGNRGQMDELVVSNRINSSDGLHHGEVGNFGNQREDLDTQGSRALNSAELSLLSAEKMKSAAKAGLSAAAVKAKLFADHEEREIQRLSANIINHQLKRLELKLKQFAEVETLLMKECEQVEKARQRFAAERTRLLAARFGTSAISSPVNLPSAMVNNNVGNRQPIMSASTSQPSIPGYGNLQSHHPNIPLMARQQMFGFGQRFPLSAIQPSSGQSPNVMFNAQGSGQSSLNHPMLRSIPGASSGLG
ncbi:hypothetical protein Dimus_022800 [Dionaea muscipula]